MTGNVDLRQLKLLRGMARSGSTQKWDNYDEWFCIAQGESSIG